MITTCDRCKLGIYSPNNIPGDKYEGQAFYYCEATRYLIREESALDQGQTCPNFIPKNASCDNCASRDGCNTKDHISAKICHEWEMGA